MNNQLNALGDRHHRAAGRGTAPPRYIVADEKWIACEDYVGDHVVQGGTDIRKSKSSLKKKK